MHKKAILMGDEASACKIMSEREPRKCKGLGRKVTPWDQQKWDKNKIDIGIRGCLLKFRQNPLMKEELLATGNKMLAEASPSDTIWGIGISVEKAMAGEKWRGQNILGRILMETRSILREEE